MQGRVTEHHCFLLKQLMKHLRFTEQRMDDVDKEIARRIAPQQEDVDRLCTIPGVDRVTARGLLAEIGFNMDQFPSSAHLASRGGTLSGQFRKRRQAPERQAAEGQRLVSAMSLPSRLGGDDEEGQLPGVFKRRVVSRRGAKRAIIAVAHRLVIAYHLLKRTENYRELGPNHFDNINLDPT